MTVYALALLTVHDRPRYQRYASRVAESLRGFDGRLLAADEHPALIEGNWDGDKIVLIGFPDRGEFDRWSTSATYREISEDRTAATTGPVLLLTGIPEQTTNAIVASSPPGAE